MEGVDIFVVFVFILSLCLMFCFGEGMSVYLGRSELFLGSFVCVLYVRFCILVFEFDVGEGRRGYEYRCVGLYFCEGV